MHDLSTASKIRSLALSQVLVQGYCTGASFAQSGLGLSAETGPRTVVVEPVPEAIIGAAHSDAVPAAKTRLLASTMP